MKAFYPHGYCLSWQPDLLAAHVIADFLTAVAYLVIGTTLYWLGMTSWDRVMAPLRPAIPLGAAFIFLCGVNHAMAVLVVWYPAFHWQAVVKLMMMAVSLMTMGLLLWNLRTVKRHLEGRNRGGN